jgi:NADPH2:quinone reductase
MFNSSPIEQRRCADDMVRWIEEGVLKLIVGRTFPLSAAKEAVQFLEENSLKGAGALIGKVVITIE